MRQANSKKLKDYVFRPYYVKSALMWLIANNHLYKDIDIDFTIDQGWDNSSVSTAVPFFALSEDDIRAIDESEEHSTKDNEQTSSSTGQSP